MQSAVRMVGISKSFGGVRALDGVDLTVGHGEIHALLGGNGAGKSTLLKILNGVQQPDAGTVEIDGVRLEEHSPAASRKAGVAMIFQEMSLVPTLTVAQNVFLTREPRTRFGFIDDAEARRRARALLEEFGVDIDPSAAVESLSAGEQQLTEIVKAVSMRSRVLILDEPTTALSGSETQRLFVLLRRLQRDGVAIVYVSHRMDEVLRIADTATILRNGLRIASAPLSEFTMSSLIDNIVGRATIGLEASVHRQAHGEPIVELRGVGSARRPEQSLDMVLHRGEVVGIAGLLGSGRSSLARMLCGIEPIARGEMRIDGEAVRFDSPRAAISRGIALVPEDRRRLGLVADHSVADNLQLPGLDSLSRASWIDVEAARVMAEDMIARLRIKTASSDSAVGTLSGGNAQKVVIAKWLATGPSLLVLDEPTAGVDIGSKSEIVALVRDLASQGKAVLVLSSELAELLAASDRILVMSNGHLVREVSRRELDAASAGGSDAAERLQRAERHLEMAIQAGVAA